MDQGRVYRLCFKKGKSPLVYTTAYAHYHSVSQPVETLQGMCQAGVPDKGTVRIIKSVFIRESQCRDLSLSVTVMGAA